MIWKEKVLSSVADFVDAILLVDTKEEAQLFLYEYTKENLNAKEDIGYMAGYCSREKATKIFDLFDTEHPYFGRKFPSTEEALALGMEMSRSKKKQNRQITDPFTPNW